MNANATTLYYRVFKRAFFFERVQHPTQRLSQAIFRPVF
jgi:hypothetical protein